MGNNLSIRGLVKRADATGEAFAQAVQGMNAQQLKADAMTDVGSMALLGLGTGVAGRGLVGLVNLLRAKPKKTRSGPVTTGLPYPVAVPKLAGDKTAGLVSDLTQGNLASTKSGIPWYGPAMMGAGLGSLALGWKGLDTILQRRREKEQAEEIEAARGDFHDALMGSYSKPVVSDPDLVRGVKRAAAPGPMAEAGAALDNLFEKVAAIVEKGAFDFANAGGQALGGYGIYAGLTGLMTGAMVYDRMQKRSRRAILEKAMQRRQRRKFMQSPTEIYAVPEPVTSMPTTTTGQDARLIAAPVGE